MGKWLAISKAPRDGTVILVTETPNGEHWNVMPACWMALRAENITPNTHLGRWWGIDVAHWLPSEGPLHVRWKPLAITPICWQPMPEHDPVPTLRRRNSAIYRRKPTTQPEDADHGV